LYNPQCCELWTIPTLLSILIHLKIVDLFLLSHYVIYYRISANLMLTAAQSTRKNGPIRSSVLTISC
ncbi:unnamed protein product, partial [Cylicocyclus nassatus]